jgi:hypothetical protein
MTKYDEGTRVGVILSATETTVNLLGYGVYKGIEKSPAGYETPKIELDNGRIVWGYQCWWGPQEKIEKMCVGKLVKNVTM